MGMSASQARLLSITARLSDNELRSQTITTAKMALASKTSEASSAYINALSETELMFTTYDDDGNKTLTNLTAACLTQYGELKNQYGVVNTSGQIMVSETDATNYKESANIAEFLAKYGYENSFKEQITTQFNEGKYNNALDQYEKAYSQWQTEKPNKDDYTKIEYQESTNDELYQLFLAGEGSCGNAAKNKGWACYLHVLTHLLDQEWNKGGSAYDSSTYPGKAQTTTGIDVDIDYQYIWGAAISQTPDLIPVSSAIVDTSDPNNTYYASGIMGPDLTTTATDKEKLLSDYYYDTSGNLQKKLLKDKIVDMYYILEDHTSGNTLGTTDEELLDLYASFQEDMKLKKKVPIEVFDEDGYNDALKDWEAREPQPPNEDDIEFNETIEYIKVDADSEEGQWYINLWHRMNGPSIFKTTIDGEDNGVHDTRGDGVVEGDNVFSPTTGMTEDGKPLWTVLEDGLMNSSEWLKYALDNGYVTLERVDYTNPTEYGTGIKHYTWDSIIASNAADITEQVNEAAITRAEVEYQQTVRDIEAKDKQYDNILKRLDTEHSALQTEYDSIKSVISKNIERTLKMYS